MNFYPFNHKGLVLQDGNKAVLKTETGHLCGYVAIPASEIPASWHGNYDADALQYLSIHGGLTYCDVEDNYVVFGFDCAHAGDDVNPILQDPQHVMELTRQMEQQINEYKSRLDEWKRSDRETKIRIMDEIIKTADIGVELGFGAMISILSGATEFDK